MRRGVECGLVALASLASGCGGAGTLQTAPRPAPSSPSRAATRVARARHRHPAIAARAIAVQSGGSPRRRIALTFDADMTRQMRARIVAGLAPEQVGRPLLETLRRTRTPATLVLTGM
ncbi:MAG: hypothetical protein JWO74_3375 [Solirubrobacterales bacterium]|nr:hypothetical protein [Solirubrobacterales bacterium]